MGEWPRLHSFFMSHPSFWQNEQTLSLAAAQPFLPFLGGGAALQAAEKFDTVGELLFQARLEGGSVLALSSAEGFANGIKVWDDS